MARKIDNLPFLSQAEQECLEALKRIYPLLRNGDPISNKDLLLAHRGFSIVLHGLEQLGDRFALEANEIRSCKRDLEQFGVARGILKY